MVVNSLQILYNEILIRSHKIYRKVLIIGFSKCPFCFQDIHDTFTVKVWSFQQMNNVLKAAGPKKVKEVQMCLEG